LGILTACEVTGVFTKGVGLFCKPKKFKSNFWVSWLAAGVNSENVIYCLCDLLAFSCNNESMFDVSGNFSSDFLTVSLSCLISLGLTEISDILTSELDCFLFHCLK